MIRDIELRVSPRDAANDAALRRLAAEQAAVGLESITALRIIRRSIDARQRAVFINLTLRLYIGEPMPEMEFCPVDYMDVSSRRSVIIVGAGPAGLFAALRLIELGLRPVVIERGKNVRDRKRDLALIRERQQVNPESNYAFGEGGAGAYSDGKLHTRSKKRGDGEKILRVLCQHGADTAILADAHPHIGTDRLPRVIERIRQTIIDCGGEVCFETRMTDLLTDARGHVAGIATADGREFNGPVILATGHSARDVFRLLHGLGLQLEAKGLAVGVRLEHPALLIDRMQYHDHRGRGPYLPAAEYSLVRQSAGRGVYSFCMCPGGVVVPAASGPEQIVVNGMSPSNRGGRWSNSGIVVEVRPEDVPGDDAMRLLHYQEQLERTCWQQGNMRQTAPAQRMADFTAGRLSYDLPASSYAPGLISSPLHFWLPSPIVTRLRDAFAVWGRQRRGFLTNEATVIGVETRTSSPLRIVRDPITLQHTRLPGLFPCGEGAGYAGGIVSAAVDGERCAEAVAQYLA